MRQLVLGTAGHIDHGKTTLVHALTGTDTDRLPEEKRRGITIDLGFARLPLDDQTELSVVDVPGHEAFVRTMVAGASGIDLVLLVIAADEGVMPQTREHLAICGMLGATRGVVALTKSDLADPDWLDLVRDDVRELLSTGPLAAAPVIPVSARTRTGLDALLDALRTVSAAVPPRRDDDLFRMPIDRAFTVHGTGTVITGTVWSGTLRRDETVRVEPAGLQVRVRALQQHGRACDVVTAGSRAAIALVGVDRDAIARGDVAITDPHWRPTRRLTVHIRSLDSAPVLTGGRRVRVNLGTAEIAGRLAALSEALEPGGEASAQIRLDRPVLARVGDPAVLRSWSPVETIAGAQVLDADPRQRRLSPETRSHLPDLLRTDTVLDAAIRLGRDSGVPLAELPVRTGLRPAVVESALAQRTELMVTRGRVRHRGPLEQLAESVLTAVASYHRTHPLEEGVSREALRRTVDVAEPILDAALDLLLGDGRLAAQGSTLARPDHRPTVTPELEPLRQEVLEIYRTAGIEAPELDDLPAGLRTRGELLPLLRVLEGQGALIRINAERFVAAPALESARSTVQARAGEDLVVGDFRDILGVSRRHLIPLLEYFDRTGLTRRNGDRRTVVRRKPV